MTTPAKRSVLRSSTGGLGGGVGLGAGLRDAAGALPRLMVVRSSSPQPATSRPTGQTSTSATRVRSADAGEGKRRSMTRP